MTPFRLLLNYEGHRPSESYWELRKGCCCVHAALLDPALWYA